MIAMVSKTWNEFNENRFALPQWLTHVEKKTNEVCTFVPFDQISSFTVQWVYVLCVEVPLGGVNWIMMWPSSTRFASSSSTPVKDRGKGYSEVLTKPKRSRSIMAVQVRKWQALPLYVCLLFASMCVNEKLQEKQKWFDLIFSTPWRQK